MRDVARPCTGWALLRPERRGLAVAAAFSLASGTLMLAAPLYSLQLLDRVITSGHRETLLLLTLMLVLAVTVMAALEACRATLLGRTGARVADRLLGRVVEAAVQRGTPAGPALRDLDSVRHALPSPAMVALFELPWVPLACLVAALLHPWLGLFAVGSVGLLGLLALLAERLVRDRVRAAHDQGVQVQLQGEAVARRGEVVRAMGMLPALVARLDERHRRGLIEGLRAGEVGSRLGGLVRALRVLVQSLVLGLGAWLVIERQITPGAMIAGSIVVGRALAPVEQLMSGWRTLIHARQALARLARLLGQEAPVTAPMRLPSLVGRLELEAAVVADPAGRALLKGVDLDLAPGTMLGVIGPSAAGKSTLCRALVGALPLSRGRALLGGADLARLPAVTLGSHVGYLPQEPMLLAGTIAQNIARMTEQPEPETVIEAARAAGLHDAILRLPEGYDTPIDDGGSPLSGGMRQRIGLARALYGRPPVVVLDEPNANLDVAGEAALQEALAHLAEIGTTVVMVTHRPQLLARADLVLVIEDGAVRTLGPRDEVLGRLLRPSRVA